MQRGPSQPAAGAQTQVGINRHIPKILSHKILVKDNIAWLQCCWANNAIEIFLKIYRNISLNLVSDIARNSDIFLLYVFLIKRFPQQSIYNFTQFLNTFSRLIYKRLQSISWFQSTIAHTSSARKSWQYVIGRWFEATRCFKRCASTKRNILTLGKNLWETFSYG